MASLQRQWVVSPRRVASHFVARDQRREAYSYLLVCVNTGRHSFLWQLLSCPPVKPHEFHVCAPPYYGAFDPRGHPCGACCFACASNITLLSGECGAKLPRKLPVTLPEIPFGGKGKSIDILFRAELNQRVKSNPRRLPLTRRHSLFQPTLVLTRRLRLR